LLVSARTGEGIGEVWRATEGYFKTSRASGELDRRHRAQAVESMHALIAESLCTRFYASVRVKK